MSSSLTRRAGVAPTVGLLIALLVWLAAPPLRAAETGVISGTISNAATGNLLEGARVNVPRLGRAAFADETGRYVLTGLPPGTHEVEVSYIGLDPVRAEVVVASGGRAERNFDLTTGIYKLDAFKVTGEREGDAAALTSQRNAENLKNVVAMDSFGNLPNMSAGEVVMRLPGVAGSPTDEGLAYGFNMRGMDRALNTVTVDGGLMPSLGTNRAFELQSITGTMFEALELIKGHTPDKGADSLGGTINLKTRSPLSMREKRRTTYSFTTRWAPPFLEQIPIREQHRAHPLATVAYQEVFDTFGGQRNLAIALNAFYSENAVGGTSTTFDYQNTVNPAAYIWDFRMWDNFNNRKQASLNLRTDYRWSPTTRFSVALLGNNNSERFRRRMEVRAFTGSATTTPNATTTGVVPGLFSDRITVVRPVPAANIDVYIDGPRNYYVRTRRIDFSGEHEYRNWQIDYTAGVGYTHLNNGDGTAGTLRMRLAGAGWIIDRTHSDLFPSFVQNGGPDFLNPDNYRPTSNGLTNVNNQNDQGLRQARFNARYQVPITAPLFIKTGVSWREQVLDIWGKDNHRWSYIGTGPLAADPDMPTYHARETGLTMPRWYSNMFMDKRQPRDPALWREDRYYHETQKFTGTRGLTETAQAAYIMAQGRLGREGRLGRTGYLGGVRIEDTTVDSWGWVRARSLSTTAQQTADPAGTAQRDYANNYREVSGSYRKAFPSIHAYHDLTPNLKARLSYSTSFGRAGLSNFLPSESPDETNQRVTVNNPGLQPQTARSWDASVEYYFEPVGQLSVGWFHKEIRDFIISNQEIRTIPGGPDNGYDGEYEGWTERSSLNAGTAIAQGWEFSYRQQFNFLPGVLKGLAGSFNYTWIDTHGMYAGTTYLTRREVQGFIPHAANASLSWRHRNFSARVLYNFTGEYISSFNAASPALRLYRMSYKSVNAGVSYQFRPTLGVSLDVANMFNEPQVFYRGYKDRTQRTLINFVTLSAGINGRF
ncbi:MAG: TonB-dependent receptor [Opitutaceae bacterium]|nr:TonB-dependent receptor [Opitutaceae bacterium]